MRGEIPDWVAAWIAALLEAELAPKILKEQ